MLKKNFKRRTKIVATLGPASYDKDVLQALIISGLDVARVNFSHGTPEQHAQVVRTIRETANNNGKTVCILADLQGPKIRVCKFKDGGKILLKNGTKFHLDATLGKEDGNENEVGIDYKDLPDDVKKGDLLLLDDGKIVLHVDSVSGKRVTCTVEAGGILSNNKGINKQGGGLTAPALTAKDKEDLKVAVSLGAEYIAISFPRCAEDIIEAKSLIAAENGQCGVIAKIERAEAIVPGVLDEIIRASDGIMVARGDLAVEIYPENVPAAQKLMIRRACDLNKPVIVATQMLETMITEVVPTRAEVSDVANAVLDNADAVMLSAETAAGKHPALVVQTMCKICTAAEHYPCTLAANYRIESYFNRIDEVISMAGMYIANHTDIKAIICLTETGCTPLWMSRIRTEIPIYGLSRHRLTLGRMALYRGVYPVEFDVTQFKTVSAVKRAAIVELQQIGCIQTGDTVLVTCGDHIGVQGMTNSLTILKVGDQSTKNGD